MPGLRKPGKDPIMKMPDIRKKAEALGIKAGRAKKADLILSIQRAEGNTACFGTGTPACPYKDCCWWDDCVVGN